MLEFPLVLVIFLGIQTFVTFSIFSYQYSPLYKTHNTYFKWMVFMVFTKTVFLFTIGLISCFYEVHQCNPIEYILHNTVLIMDLFLCRDMLSVVTPPTKTNIQIVNLISTHSFVIIATIICFIDPFKQSYILLGTSSFIGALTMIFWTLDNRGASKARVFKTPVHSTTMSTSVRSSAAGSASFEKRME